MSTIIKTKIKGTVYCYRSESYWDKEEKKAKSRRTLIGKIDPETGEMVPTQPRGGRRGKHADDSVESTVSDENAEVYRRQCEELKARLLEMEQELVSAKDERDKALKKYKRLSEAVKAAADLA